MFGLHKINSSANTHSRISQDQGLFIYAYIQPTSHSEADPFIRQWVKSKLGRWSLK